MALGNGADHDGQPWPGLTDYWFAQNRGWELAALPLRRKVF